MQRYLDHAAFWDLLVAIIIGVILYFGQPIFEGLFVNSTSDTLNGFGSSLITVSATLVGFFLTIITVIVTFKKGFEDESKDGNNQRPESGIPEKTVFEKRISKEEKFYATPIHKRVVDVFVSATYEIGLVLFILLTIQLKVFNFPLTWILIISFCVFILMMLSTIRSLYIFKLFLKVHLHQ